MRFSIDGIEAGPRHRVRELDATVIGAAAGSNKIALMRGPSKCFDGRLVLRARKLRQLRSTRSCTRCSSIPDAKKILIAARGKLVSLGRPFEAANFLSMAGECGYVVSSDAHVMMHDGGVYEEERQRM